MQKGYPETPMGRLMSSDDEQLELFSIPQPLVSNAAVPGRPYVPELAAPLEFDGARDDTEPRHVCETAQRGRAAKSKHTQPPSLPASLAETPETTPAAVKCFLSYEQVAARYGISRQTLWRWRKDPALGFPETVQLGSGTIRWRVSDLEAYEQHKLVAIRERVK